MYAAKAFHILVVATTTMVATACTTRSLPPVDRLELRHGWARIADSGTTSAAYMEIANNDSVPMVLVGVTTVDADAAEVHETMQHDGMAQMMPRTELRIPVGEVFKLEPGGVHVMLIALKRRLAVGDSVRLRLHFSDSTDVNVVVPVRTP